MAAKRSICVLVLTLAAGQSAAQTAAPNAKVTYQDSRISVEQVVIALARQVGLGYNWRESLAQASPECRQALRQVSLRELPFATAMHRLLDPVGLDYELENGEVVLFHVQTGLPPDVMLEAVMVNHEPAPPIADLAERLAKKVSYASSGKSVQYVVIDLVKLVGLRYNFTLSLALSDPYCRRTVAEFSVANLAFGKAMARVLNPVGLQFRVEGDEVVLYRR